ncbi:MAG: hypothetical protein MHM6MM_003114 [Cercozoa sp. M6MM]
MVVSAATLAFPVDMAVHALEFIELLLPQDADPLWPKHITCLLEEGHPEVVSVVENLPAVLPLLLSVQHV